MAEKSEPLQPPTRPDPSLPWTIQTPFLWIEFGTAWVNYAVHEFATFQMLESVGKLAFLFSIIAAAVAYVWEAPNRAKQLQLEAYSLLATASNGHAPAARAEAFDVLYKAKLPLVGLNLSFVDLTKYQLAKVDLRSCSLSDATLGADLQGVIFTNSVMYRANFVKPADLSSAQLVRCQLGDAQLGGATLDGANLTGAHLKADLDDRARRYGAAIIKNASMVKAVLTEADCSYVVFDGVDVAEAIFTDAVLDDADLSSAKNLTQMQVESALTILRTLLPEHIDRKKAEEAIKTRMASP